MEVFLLALPIVLIEVALGIVGPGSWHSYVHAFLLLYGFLIAADHRLDEAVRQNWGRALVVGVAALPGLFIIAFFDLGGSRSALGTDVHSWSLAFRLLKATAGCAWTFAIFGFASLVATLLVYDLGIRRTKLTRLLFGMPPTDPGRSFDVSQGPVAGDRR